MAVQSLKGKLPHIQWLDLHDDGTLVECAIMRTDVNKNIYFIQVDKLDSIDKQRLVKILTSRNVDSMELWDAMSSVTLGNGLNALKYFHQLVKIITDSGKIMSPQLGKQGVVLVDTEAKNTPTPQQMAEAQALLETGDAANVKPAKKSGRKTANA
jgi:hypothetical protein